MPVSKSSARVHKLQGHQKHPDQQQRRPQQGKQRQQQRDPSSKDTKVYGDTDNDSDANLASMRRSTRSKNKAKVTTTAPRPQSPQGGKAPSSKVTIEGSVPELDESKGQGHRPTRVIEAGAHNSTKATGAADKHSEPGHLEHEELGQPRPRLRPKAAAKARLELEQEDLEEVKVTGADSKVAAELRNGRRNRRCALRRKSSRIAAVSSSATATTTPETASEAEASSNDVGSNDSNENSSSSSSSEATKTCAIELTEPNFRKWQDLKRQLLFDRDDDLMCHLMQVREQQFQLQQDPRRCSNDQDDQGYGEKNPVSYALLRGAKARRTRTVLQGDHDDDDLSIQAQVKPIQPPRYSEVVDQICNGDGGEFSEDERANVNCPKATDLTICLAFSNKRPSSTGLAEYQASPGSGPGHPHHHPRGAPDGGRPHETHGQGQLQMMDDQEEAACERIHPDMVETNGLDRISAQVEGQGRDQAGFREKDCGYDEAVDDPETAGTPLPDRNPPESGAPGPDVRFVGGQWCCICDSNHSAKEDCPFTKPCHVYTDSVIDFSAKDEARRSEDQQDDCTPSANHNPHSRPPGDLPVPFSQLSLPEVLQLRETDPSWGGPGGVIAKSMVKPLTQFGPLRGESLPNPKDIPADFPMEQLWQVFTDRGTRKYLSTANPKKSNWLRYVRPAPCREQRNLVAVYKDQEVFFVTCRGVSEGEELLYWVDDPFLMWYKSGVPNKSCDGHRGCHAKFTHPLYYRLHCTVFHEPPRFSLTIRKYSCKICGSTLLGKDSILKHALSAHEGKGAFRCTSCNKYFLQQAQLENHQCPASPSNSSSHASASISCEFCGKRFCQPQKLKAHLKRSHGGLCYLRAKHSPQLQCHICLKSMETHQAIRHHIKEVHPSEAAFKVVGRGGDPNATGSGLLSRVGCPKCGRSFKNKSNLKIHMLTHSGVKPFGCKIEGCRSGFTTKQCLQFHYRKTHGFSDGTMPDIRREIPYTLSAYSGGLAKDEDDFALQDGKEAPGTIHSDPAVPAKCSWRKTTKRPRPSSSPVDLRRNSHGQQVGGDCPKVSRRNGGIKDVYEFDEVDEGHLEDVPSKGEGGVRMQDNSRHGTLSTDCSHDDDDDEAKPGPPLQSPKVDPPAEVASQRASSTASLLVSEALSAAEQDLKGVADEGDIQDSAKDADDVKGGFRADLASKDEKSVDGYGEDRKAKVSAEDEEATAPGTPPLSSSEVAALPNRDSKGRRSVLDLQSDGVKFGEEKVDLDRGDRAPRVAPQRPFRLDNRCSKVRSLRPANGGGEKVVSSPDRGDLDDASSSSSSSTRGLAQLSSHHHHHGHHHQGSPPLPSFVQVPNNGPTFSTLGPPDQAHGYRNNDFYPLDHYTGSQGPQQQQQHQQAHHHQHHHPHQHHHQLQQGPADYSTTFSRSTPGGNFSPEGSSTLYSGGAAPPTLHLGLPSGHGFGPVGGSLDLSQPALGSLHHHSMGEDLSQYNGPDHGQLNHPLPGHHQHHHHQHHHQQQHLDPLLQSYHSHHPHHPHHQQHHARGAPFHPRGHLPFNNGDMHEHGGSKTPSPASGTSSNEGATFSPAQSYQPHLSSSYPTTTTLERGRFPQVSSTPAGPFTGNGGQVGQAHLSLPMSRLSPSSHLTYHQCGYF